MRQMLIFAEGVMKSSNFDDFLLRHLRNYKKRRLHQLSSCFRNKNAALQLYFATHQIDTNLAASHLHVQRLIATYLFNFIVM